MLQNKIKGVKMYKREFGLEVQHVPFHERRVVDHLIQQSNLLAVADVHAATNRFQDSDTPLNV